MSRTTFIRVCAVCAILGGTLRVASSFTAENTPRIYVLYFVIDLFLLFGVSGLVRSRVAEGLLGLLGYALMLLALLVLIARDIEVVPATIYAVGAAFFSLGLDLFSIQLLRNPSFTKWIPVLWIVSTLVGSIGFFVPALHFLFPISGLCFGLAFAAAGISLWRLSSSNN